MTTPRTNTPAAGDSDAQLAELVEQLAARLHAGEAVDVGAILRARPEFAAAAWAERRRRLEERGGPRRRRSGAPGMQDVLGHAPAHELDLPDMVQAELRQHPH